ncbi:MAG: nicotinate-nucleotide--dimethylbenzimidazole phosphoribosyltransferase, partial [Pseudomonadota bacterium]
RGSKKPDRSNRPHSATGIKLKAAHVTRRPAHQAALERLGMTPLADFEFNTGGGMGSVAAIGLLRTACAPFIAQPAGK